MDTATATASLAVYDLDKNELRSEWTWQARRRQTQDLLATAQQMLAQLDLNPAQLTALAVTTGPGSFTGVRIAISAAKGIGLGLPAAPKVVGIPTLSVTAAPWQGLARAASGTVQLCAYIKAGRGRYNWAFAPTGTAQPTGVLADSVWIPAVDDHGAGTADEFAAQLQAQRLQTRGTQPIWLVGEPTVDLAAAVQPLPNVFLIDEISAFRRAGQLARLAALQLQSGESNPETADTLSTLQPLYLSAP